MMMVIEIKMKIKFKKILNDLSFMKKRNFKKRLEKILDSLSKRKYLKDALNDIEELKELSKEDKIYFRKIFRENETCLVKRNICVSPLELIMNFQELRDFK